MKTKSKILFLGMACFCLFACKEKTTTLPVSLVKVQGDIMTVLNKMDSTSILITNALSGDFEYSDSAVRELFQEHFGKINGLLEIAWISPEGIMEVIVPGTLASHEGSDISKQDHIIKAKDLKQPLLSHAFKAVEGFTGVVLVRPALTEDNEVKGLITFLIRPESFLRNIITRELEGVPADIWVMQPDGLILYDFDAIEIGRNLFTDPLYQDYSRALRRAAKIAEKKSGNTTYDYLGHGLTEPVVNQAFWTTAGLYGTEWRIVLIRPKGEHKTERRPSELGIYETREALRTLGNDTLFLRFLAENNSEEVLKRFKDFYDAQQIYVIEYVDSTVTTRLGYPPEHSLKDVQFNPDDLESIQFYNAVVQRKDTKFVQKMLEESKGMFYVYPLEYEGKNLGSIYCITLEP